jgi:NADPH:quinone reductase-like Zn-dependent oxidoreductase
MEMDEMIGNFDYVLDTMGGTNIKYSLKLINWGGTLVSTWPEPRNEIGEIAHYDGIEGISKTVKANGSDMKRIADMLNSHRIRSYIDRIFSFEQIADAHRLFERGDFKGKIIVTI